MSDVPSNHRDRPFGADYPDPRSEGDRELDRREVRIQVDALGSSPKENDLEERLLLRLLERRRSWPPGQPSAPVQVDIVRSPGGARALIVPGQLLVSRRALDDETLDLRGRLAQAGFEELDEPAADDCPELADRVARFVSGAVASSDLVDLARKFRAEGLPVSANHITPLAAVVKGEGGPALTRGRRGYPGVEFGEQSHGPRVAVIDTGVAEEERTDGWLSYAAIARAKDNIDVLDQFPFPGNGFLDMATGHGTFVNGVVQQVCPTADIRVYRGPDSDGVASELQIGCAIIRAVRDGAEILNLSLGTQTVDDAPPVALSAALDVVAEIEADEGRDVLLIAAAGNFGDERPCWPAAFRRVVAVASLQADGSPATSWSSRGAWVDCSAVGEGIVSTFLPGAEDPAIDTHHPDVFGDDSWAVWTGTSFAAPQVTGAVARRCQETASSPRDALAGLLAAGVSLPEFGRALMILPGT